MHTRVYYQRHCGPWPTCWVNIIDQSWNSADPTTEWKNGHFCASKQSTFSPTSITNTELCLLSCTQSEVPGRNMAGEPCNLVFLFVLVLSVAPSIHVMYLATVYLAQPVGSQQPDLPESISPLNPKVPLLMVRLCACALRTCVLKRMWLCRSHQLVFGGACFIGFCRTFAALNLYWGDPAYLFLINLVAWDQIWRWYIKTYWWGAYIYMVMIYQDIVVRDSTPELPLTRLFVPCGNWCVVS